MNVITLSKKKFESLEPLRLSKEVINTESSILDFYYRGKHKIIKKLFYQEGRVFANKLYTLEMLSTYQQYLPESFHIPDSLISSNNHIQGFCLDFIEGINLACLLADSKVPLGEKKYYLAAVGEILRQMQTIRNYTPLNDLYLCDMHSSNFIVKTDNKSLAVVDLDSCKINGNKSSVSKYLYQYGLLSCVKGKYQYNSDESEIGDIRADENTDLYCYSMMLLDFLYGDSVSDMSLNDYYDYLDYLKRIGVNSSLVDAFYDLVSNKKNENPSGFIESLDSNQVCRAKRIVYEKVKKNIMHL